MDRKEICLIENSSVILRIENTSSISLRQEVASIIDLVADTRSIPALISLLKDPEFDVRWIAAEGLIKIGRQSIVPLIKAIRDEESSRFLRSGANHILRNILSDKEKRAVEPLLLSLCNNVKDGTNERDEAKEALKKTFRCNS
jgi:HEAT repeat protein